MCAIDEESVREIFVSGFLNFLNWLAHGTCFWFVGILIYIRKKQTKKHKFLKIFVIIFLN